MRKTVIIANSFQTLAPTLVGLQLRMYLHLVVLEGNLISLLVVDDIVRAHLYLLKIVHHIRFGNDEVSHTVKHAGFKSVEEPNSGDAIRTAFAVMNYAEYSANTIILNPITVNAIASEKDSLGRNLGLIENRNGVNYVCGKPIVEYTGIPAGKYILGDFVNGANLVDYTAMSLEWAEDVDTKLTNQVVLIAQEEVIFPVFMPWAFAYGDLSSLKTAITKS